MRSEWACNEAAHAIAEREGEVSAAAFEERRMSCASRSNTKGNGLVDNLQEGEIKLTISIWIGR